MFLESGIEVCVVLNILFFTQRSCRGEAYSGFVGELILDEGHHLALREEAIERRVEEAIRDLDQRVPTPLFVAQYFRERCRELEKRQDVLDGTFLYYFDFLDRRTYGQIDLDRTLRSLCAFLSDKDEAISCDLLDREPVYSSTELYLDVAPIAGEGDLLNAPFDGEVDACFFGLEDCISSTLLDGDTLL